MPQYAELFYEICFSDQVSKKAYLNACKWLAINVYSKDELSKYVLVQVTKELERQLPTFKVQLYITSSEKDVKIDYCAKCQTLHSVMYAIDSPDCKKCKLQAYRSQLHNNIANLVSFWGEVFTNEEQL